MNRQKSRPSSSFSSEFRRRFLLNVIGLQMIVIASISLYPLLFTWFVLGSGSAGEAIWKWGLVSFVVVGVGIGSVAGDFGGLFD